MGKAKDWLSKYMDTKYGDNSPKVKSAPKSNTTRPPRPSNKHQPTIDLINKILFSKDIPDNIRVDTLRVLAMLLEDGHPDKYVEKEFKKFLCREPDYSKVKKKEQKKKATGGWVVS